MANTAKCPYCAKVVAMESPGALGYHRAVVGLCDGSGRRVERLDHLGRAVFVSMGIDDVSPVRNAYTGDTVECPVCHRSGVKVQGISPKLANHDRPSGGLCSGSGKYVTEFSAMDSVEMASGLVHYKGFKDQYGHACPGYEAGDKTGPWSQVTCPDCLDQRDMNKHDSVEMDKWINKYGSPGHRAWVKLKSKGDNQWYEIDAANNDIVRLKSSGREVSASDIADATHE